MRVLVARREGRAYWVEGNTLYATNLGSVDTLIDTKKGPKETIRPWTYPEEEKNYYEYVVDLLNGKFDDVLAHSPKELKRRRNIEKAMDVIRQEVGF